jgi:hypothetical protein
MRVIDQQKSFSKPPKANLRLIRGITVAVKSSGAPAPSFFNTLNVF